MISNINLLFGPPRSGTSFVQKILSKSGIGIYEPTGQNVFNDPNNKVSPYLSIFAEENSTNLHSHIKSNPNKSVFVKDVPCSYVSEFLKKHETTFQSWVGEGNIKQSKTLWIFRNPIDTWKSIKAQGWDKTDFDLRKFEKFYKSCATLYYEMKHKQPSSTGVVIYDSIMKDQNKAFEKLFGFFNKPFNKKFVEGKESTEDYYSRVHYSPERRAYTEFNTAHQSLHKGVSGAKIKPELLQYEKTLINDLLMPVFKKISNYDICKNIK